MVLKLEFDLAEIDKTVVAFIKSIKNFKKIGFYGNLGSGKTTFIQAICKFLEVEDDVTSPTYGIINNYISKSGYINHVDLYRLNTFEEALEIGMEDYLFDDNYCFIEWPQIIEPMLPENFVKVFFSVSKSDKRIITIGEN